MEYLGIDFLEGERTCDVPNESFTSLREEMNQLLRWRKGPRQIMSHKGSFCGATIKRELTSHYVASICNNVVLICSSKGLKVRVASRH